MGRNSQQRKTVLIDSSALVYLIEGEAGSPRREAVERFLADAASSGSRVVASSLVWAELLERPLASGDAELAARYRRLLADSSRIELAVVDVAIAERAAAIKASLPRGARRSLSEADIIQIATAIELGADEILTNDEAWRIAPRIAPDCPPLRIIDETAFA
jgi:Predicted nucleic acid-binding protein, contains PIN domain